MAAIENAKADWARRVSGETSTDDEEDRTEEDDAVIERDDSVDDVAESATGELTTSYKEALFSIDSSDEIHELSPEELAVVVKQIVQIEGPVHEDEIARRVATLWGFKRTGSRISDAVGKALCSATFHNQLEQEGLFYSVANQSAIPIRDRSEVSSSRLRSVDCLPPSEIRAAICAVVETHLGITKNDAIVETARLFGFRSTSGQLREAIGQEIDFLVDRENVCSRNDRLYPSDTSVAGSGTLSTVGGN